VASPLRPLPPALAGEIELDRLPNGLELCLLRNAQAPIVSTALFYRVGGRDEAPGAGGIAHFLEHMMFKGSERYPPGEVDRRTQALGGNNNAFTSHDVTAYWFSFAADRWGEALAIEADRMRGLRLDPREVDSERQVIVEEIAMYRDDPWDALEMDVLAALFPNHPYGRPVLGTEEDLASEGPEELATFHRRYYRPDNALLVVAGDLDASARSRIEEAFGAIAPGAAPRPALVAPDLRAERVRLERRHGELARLMLALPAPAPDEPGHAELRIAATLLAEGRASRLQRSLVEEGQLCLGVSATVAENAGASFVAISAELLPGVEPREVERKLADELTRLAQVEAEDEELDRARQVFLADWVHGQERIHQQGLAAGLALAQFDLGQPERLLRRAASTDAKALAQAAARWLDPVAGGVLGVCLPEESGAE
jgi:zinc protease